MSVIDAKTQTAYQRQVKEDIEEILGRIPRIEPRMVEGVAYWPFLVRFTTLDGRRRVKTFWSPGRPFVVTEVKRYLEERGDVDASKRVLVRFK